MDLFAVKAETSQTLHKNFIKEKQNVRTASNIKRMPVNKSVFKAFLIL